MVTRLQKIYPPAAHFVDDPVLLGDPSRPAAGKPESERLRFPDSLEGVTQYGFHQIQDSECRAAIVLDPPPEVFQKLPMEDRFSRGATAQVPIPGEVEGLSTCGPALFAREIAR